LSHTGYTGIGSAVASSDVVSSYLCFANGVFSLGGQNVETVLSDYDYVGRGDCLDERDNVYNWHHITSPNSVEVCSVECQKLGNTRSQVGFTFILNNVCRCYYTDGQGPDGNARTNLHGGSNRGSGPISRGSNPTSSWKCYRYLHYTPIHDYIYESTGKCVDSAGQRYNSVQIDSISTIQHCAATCRSLGNLRSQAGFDYDGSTCSCLYIDGRGPNGNDESGLTLTGNNGTGFVVNADESAVGSECYSHNDYGPFEDYDYVGRGYCLDEGGDFYSYVNINSNSIEVCSVECQRLGNTRSQVGFTFIGNGCRCHYTDGQGPDGNIETNLSGGSYLGFGPISRGSDPFSNYKCYRYLHYTPIHDYIYEGTGKCVDSAGQHYNSVQIDSIGTIQHCASTCQNLDGMISQTGFEYDGSKCSCLYSAGRGPNEGSGLSISNEDGVGLVIQGDGSNGNSVCYSHEGFTETFNSEDYVYVGRGSCQSDGDEGYSSVSLANVITAVKTGLDRSAGEAIRTAITYATDICPISLSTTTSMRAPENASTLQANATTAFKLIRSAPSSTVQQPAALLAI
ncbi:hypothetical protein THAOC_08349, partial [Thalassiosira oceanica]